MTTNLTGPLGEVSSRAHQGDRRRPVLKAESTESVTQADRSGAGILERVRRSLRHRGMIGALRHGFSTLRWRLLEMGPAARRRRESYRRIDEEFDRLNGTDTGGIIRMTELEVDSENWAQGAFYMGSDPKNMRPCIEALGIRWEDYTFVDYGSGKGRAVLLASEFPFKKIVGVEFCKEFVRISRQNLQIFKGKRQCADVEVVCEDAAKYVLPPGPLVLYFYNPFWGEMMRKVVKIIAESYAAAPRSIIVMYINLVPEAEASLAEATFLRRVSSEDYRAVYCTPEAITSAGSGCAQV